MYNLLDDLSVLTNIKKYNFEQICDLSIDIFNYDILENINKKEPVTTIDIGIGILYIINDSDTIKYKFIPSSKLEKSIRNAYKGKNQLENKVDTQLGNRLNNSYKELF